jgi:Transposase domain (DUF772)
MQASRSHDPDDIAERIRVGDQVSFCVVSSDTRIAGIGPAAVRRACACSSERRLCEAVHLILAYCWFCRLGLEGKVADHATFLKNRHGRFRYSDASAIPSVVPLENIRWPS